MAVAAPELTPPPRSRARRLAGTPIATVVAAVLAGLAIFAFFGHAFLNYDTFYALEWGKQLAHGMTPDYKVPVAPTPHPLAELVGMPLSLFGDAAEWIVLALVVFAIGMACVALYRLGSELYAWPVGVLAAAIFATRVPPLNYGIRGYVDLPAIAFILWAAVLESRHARRGVPVLILLGLAGLLRPEAWLFSAVYWLWLAPPLGWPARIRLALLAAAAPLLWMLSDLLITGDALWSLHGTHELAAQLGRKTGLGNLAPVMPRRLGEIMRLPELLASVVGFGLGLWLLRRRTLLPAAIALLNGFTFVVLAIAGLPLLGRYLFLAGAVLSLFAALGALGWLALGPEHPWRPRWRVLGLVVIAAIAVLFPLQQVGRLTALRDDIAHRAQIDSDLHALVRSRPASGLVRSCRRIYVPNHRPVPQLAYWTGKRPSDVSGAAPRRGGLYIGPTTPAVAKLSILDPKDPRPVESFPPGKGPPGWAAVARNRSWILWDGCGAASRG